VSRTQAGILRARELGVQFGRKPKLNTKQRQIIAERYQGGETMAALARDFRVSEPTVWRALRGIVETVAASVPADKRAVVANMAAPVPTRSADQASDRLTPTSLA